MSPAFYRLRDLVNTPAKGDRPERRGLVAVSRTTWWRWVADGRAPQPVKLSRGVLAWRVSDIDAWIRSHDAPKPAPASAAERAHG
jgi:predicted DNA-binding transcriptional regulator AlpA